MTTLDVTPTSAVSELARLSRQLQDLGFKLRDAEIDAVRKRHAHSVAYAKAIIAADGTNAEIRKAQATLATEESSLAADLAEAELRILRSDIRDVLGGRIDVGRSVVGVLRAEAQVVR